MTKGKVKCKHNHPFGNFEKGKEYSYYKSDRYYTVIDDDGSKVKFWKIDIMFEVLS